MLLFLIIVYEEAIKRLQSFWFPFSGHSSISVIFFWEKGWAKWIECTRRARTINLYNGTVLFYLLFSTFFLNALSHLACFYFTITTDWTNVFTRLLSCAFFFSHSFLLSSYNSFRTQKRAWLILMCCSLSASPCLCHIAFHLLLWRLQIASASSLSDLLRVFYRLG